MISCCDEMPTELQVKKYRVRIIDPFNPNLTRELTIDGGRKKETFEFFVAPWHQVTHWELLD
jgi:hypothetical protein